MLKTFVSNNLWTILALIFSSGAAYNTLNDQDKKLKEHDAKFVELEENKVSKASLELQREVLTHQVKSILAELETLKGRMRRAIDSGVNKNTKELHYLEVKINVLEQKLKDLEK